MNFTLTITASPELLEAISLLTGAMGTRPAPVNEPVTPVTPTRTRKGANPAPVEAKEETAQESPAEPPTETTETVVTVETVRAAVQVKAQNGKRDAVKTLLTEFEVTRVTDLPETKYASFLKAVEAL